MICPKGQLRGPWLGHRYPYSYPVPLSPRLISLLLQKEEVLQHEAAPPVNSAGFSGCWWAHKCRRLFQLFQPSMHWVMSIGSAADVLSNKDKLSWFSYSLTASCFINNKTISRKWKLSGQSHATLAVVFNWRPRQIFPYNFQNIKFLIEMNF